MRQQRTSSPARGEITGKKGSACSVRVQRAGRGGSGRDETEISPACICVACTYGSFALILFLPFFLSSSLLAAPPPSLCRRASSRIRGSVLFSVSSKFAIECRKYQVFIWQHVSIGRGNTFFGCIVVCHK